MMCKGGVHEGLGSRAALNPNTPRARSGPVRISVAYGNIPAPGLGKEKTRSQEVLRIHKSMNNATIIKKHVLFHKIVIENMETYRNSCREIPKLRKLRSKASNSEPKGTKSKPKGAKREPKVSQRGPKGNQRDTKGSQK